MWVEVNAQIKWYLSVYTFSPSYPFSPQKKRKIISSESCMIFRGACCTIFIFYISIHILRTEHNV